MRTHLDLFSGIGGFALAAQWNGFTTVGFSEIEPYACKVLARHWPNVTNFGDIRNVQGVNADLLTAGPPCQPASCAGKRRGSADDRWLWPQTLECVERIRPAFCLFENPCGFLTLNGGVEFERVLSALESLGYAVQSFIIPACAIGAIHRRDRVWITANFERRQRSLGRDISGIGWERQQIAAAANSDGARLEERFLFRDFSTLEGFRHERQNASVDAARDDQPILGRKLHGIPNRMDRLKGLGNAIVPQVAAQIIAMMVQAEVTR